MPSYLVSLVESPMKLASSIIPLLQMMKQRVKSVC